METIKRIINIDLKEYGSDGEIVIRMPSARKQNEFLNATSKYVVQSENGRTLKDGAPLGDIQILTMLQYISKAPFSISINGFLDFTDSLEPEQSIELQRRIEEAIKEVVNGSPFAGSPSMGTDSSE